MFQSPIFHLACAIANISRIGHLARSSGCGGGSMNVDRSSRWLVLILPLMAILGEGTTAQEYRGVILGRAVDSSGAIILGATITAKGPQQTYISKTNSSGDFSIPFVQPGKYDVTAEAKGFKKVTQTGVIIDVAQKVNLNF